MEMETWNVQGCHEGWRKKPDNVPLNLIEIKGGLALCDFDDGPVAFLSGNGSRFDVGE
jgi:hypothetical protein